MKTARALGWVALVGLLALGAGCGPKVASPTLGLLYTDVTWGADAEGGNGMKQGKACAQTLLGLLATGDASIETAKRAAGIKEVVSVDYYSHHVLGLMGEFCTIVTGR